MNEFKDWIGNTEFQNIHTFSARYTWTNGRKGFDTWQVVNSFILSRNGSDHCPIHLENIGKNVSHFSSCKFLYM